MYILQELMGKNSLESTHTGSDFQVEYVTEVRSLPLQYYR